jgi:hypothetical protein
MNSPFAIALVVFVGAFGGALLGMLLGRVLPSRHLSDAARDTIKLGAGVVGTMTALVLGFLVSSASNSLERISVDLAQIAGNAILLDRTLANYGPEAADIRGMIREIYATELELLLSESEQSQLRLTTLDTLTRVEALPRQIRELSPTSEAQQTYQLQGIAIANEISADRWLLLFQGWNAIPVPLLIALVMWLAATFGFFGLFAPRNATVVGALSICALSAATAVFLIDEMNTPFSGWIRLSSEPLRQALLHLGQ